MTTSRKPPSLLQAFPQPAMMIGADARITAQNAAMKRVLGADLTGRHHIAGLRQPTVLEAIEAAEAQGTAQKTRYLGRDGAQDTTYDVTVAPTDEGLLVVFEDISAAARIGRFRRDFVANVSHELRTPLTALLGFVETLQGPAKNDPDATARFLGIMGHEADRMRRLVDDLLSLSRVEGDERIRPKDMVDLAALIPSVVALLSPLADAAGCPLDVDTPDGPLMVPGDDAQLRQVLTNLIENALKYGKSGDGIRISVAGPKHERMLQADGVRIMVRDHGIGIADHHLARLTERFYRVDSHRSREVGGTGLGLAIVKHILNRHRGRLLVESQAGQGSTFTILLPARLPAS
ncbi:sensor histidine kinase [Yoonia sp. 208BN28-4]|uniref:sensor histidine kinase n=1 Tax=Yoonia sp. 208BN28-4 TaxID=3126505 RepID=UPI0030ACFE42